MKHKLEMTMEVDPTRAATVSAPPDRAAVDVPAGFEVTATAVLTGATDVEGDVPTRAYATAMAAALLAARLEMEAAVRGYGGPMNAIRHAYRRDHPQSAPCDMCAEIERLAMLNPQP